MTTFRSKSPYLSVPGKPFEVRTLVNGQTTIRPITPNYEFRNHTFKTDDPNVIAELRASHAHKLGFFIEDPDTVQVPPDVQPETPKPAIALGVASKNGAIAYLVQEHGVKPDELRGLKAGEVKALALSKFSVDFADWNV